MCLLSSSPPKTSKGVQLEFNVHSDRDAFGASVMLIAMYSAYFGPLFDSNGCVSKFWWTSAHLQDIYAQSFGGSLYLAAWISAAAATAALQPLVMELGVTL
jgi:hypothetical protein